MAAASVCESLETSLDEADNVIIVTVAWKGVVDVESLQKLYVKLGIMPDFSPFLSLHMLPECSFQNKAAWPVSLSTCFLGQHIVP